MAEEGAGLAEPLINQLVDGNRARARRVADLMRTTTGQEHEVAGTEVLWLATSVEPIPP
jgi:hypothetical protein